MVCLPRTSARFGCTLRTVVGSKVIFDEALPSVVAPAMEMLGSILLPGSCATSDAGQPHCATVKPKSGGPISSLQYWSAARMLKMVPGLMVVTESITPPLPYLPPSRWLPPTPSMAFELRTWLKSLHDQRA